MLSAFPLAKTHSLNVPIMAKLTRTVIRNAVFVAVILGVVVLLIRRYSSDNLELFSSNASPDGSLQAENFLVGDCAGACATGLIVISNQNGGRSDKILLPEPMPGIFFRWIDNADLQILYSIGNGSSGGLEVPAELNGVHISAIPYQWLSAATANIQAAQKRTYEFNESDLEATFSSIPGPNATTCTLKISGNHGKEFERYGIEIDAHRSNCYRAKNKNLVCGGMKSRFWVSKQLSGNRQLILTSADVDGAKGYGVLPTGANHMAIRGQFLEERATRVMNLLKSGAVIVDYNFDFSNLSIQYLFPLLKLSLPISQFIGCVGDTDFQWVRHTAELGSK